jgi:hypothetical protein
MGKAARIAASVRASTTTCMRKVQDFKAQGSCK